MTDKLSISRGIADLPDGVDPQDAATVNQLGGSGIPQGGPLTADLDADGFKITGLADGVAADDAATVGQIAGGGIPQGGPLTADLDADGFKIENAADPSNAQDYVTKAYGDANYGGGSGTPLDGWVDDTADTWTYATGSGGGTATFTVSGDKTATFTPGTRIKLTQTTVKYFVVISSAHAAGTTTVTITAGTAYTLANAAISANYHSYAENPQGYPGWFAFAAGLTGTSALTINLARFAVIGRVCFVALTLSGTSNATTKVITLPVTPANVTNMQWICPLTVRDNGATQTTPGEVVINANNASASLFRNTAAAAWTASGGWFAIGEGRYEI